MKNSIRSREQGSMLIITLCIALLIGLGLVSYLWLVYSQNRLVSRSLYWNIAIANAEAGLEEALAQLNYTYGTQLNRAANGWTGPSGGVYGPMVRNLKTGAYRATISTHAYPIIVSIGYATNLVSGGTVSRTVEATTRAAGPFQVGMAAKLEIDFKGNYVYIDSFDSADPNHSTNGNYYAPWAKSGGDIASTEGLVNVQNADVHGKVRTGPSGSYVIGSMGLVGPIGWNGPGLYAPDWYENDFNADFKDVDPPNLPGLVLPAALPNSETNHMIFIDGKYYVAGNFKMTGTPSTLLVVGNVELYVTGDFLIPAGWEIKIEPDATLKIYVGTKDGPPVSGEFGNVNTSITSDAAAFTYRGLPSNNAVTWSGNNAFKGTVYAPQATFTLGGGGMNEYDYQVACVVKDVKLNGKFNFHYDENLKRKASPAGFVVASWREL